MQPIIHFRQEKHAVSEQNPTFIEALEAVNKILGLETGTFKDIFDRFADDIERAFNSGDVEDTALSYIALRKKVKEDREARDFTNVDEALDKLGVDKETDVTIRKPLVTNVTVGARESGVAAAQKRLMDAQQRCADAQRDLADAHAAANAELAYLQDEAATESEFLGNDMDDECGDLWEIVLRGEWATAEQFHADHIELGNSYGDSDGTLTAYLNDEVVFHAPAGTYQYARKITA